MNFLRSENDLEFRRDQRIEPWPGLELKVKTLFIVTTSFMLFCHRVLIDRHEAHWCRILLLISNKNTGTIYRARVHFKSKSGPQRLRRSMPHPLSLSMNSRIIIVSSADLKISVPKTITRLWNFLFIFLAFFEFALFDVFVYDDRALVWVCIFDCIVRNDMVLDHGIS